MYIRISRDTTMTWGNASVIISMRRHVCFCLLFFICSGKFIRCNMNILLLYVIYSWFSSLPLIVIVFKIQKTMFLLDLYNHLTNIPMSVRIAYHAFKCLAYETHWVPRTNSQQIYKDTIYKSALHCTLALVELIYIRLPYKYWSSYDPWNVSYSHSMHSVIFHKSSQQLHLHNGDSYSAWRIW